MADIIITGLDEVLAKLKKLERMSELRPVMKAAAEHVKGKVDNYPPATAANQPNPRVYGGRVVITWYERGYGQKYQRKDGSVGGRKTSETLGRRWTTKVLSDTSASIGNNASYAPFVQDEREQATFHRAHGWKTAQQVAREETPTVVSFVVEAIGRMVE